MLRKKKFNTETVTTVIGKESAVKGVIHSQQSIRIEGTFEGEINCQGRVYIAEGSQLKAQVFARDVIIAGEVIGDIEVHKSLHILNTGRVYGSISGDQLKIEEGGVYKGKVNMDVISSKNIYEGRVLLSKD